MIKGFDISSLVEIESCGGRYFEDGKQKDLLKILFDNGINMTRIRLWNDPYSEQGKPYGAGTCDFKKVEEMARRSVKAGMDYILDFMYSDFWCDPGKQYTPKAWRNLNVDELETAVYSFTKKTVQTLCDEGSKPAIVSVGNEITNGMLWPSGNAKNFDVLVRYINAGIKAVHEVDPAIKILLHVDKGTDNSLFNFWFDSYFKNGGMDFDYIGMSYYCFWHGPMEGLRDNMSKLYERYHKKMIVTETSTAWTLVPYNKYEGLSKEEAKGMATTEKVAPNMEYPATAQGQIDYMNHLIDICRQTKGCEGFVYWGGESIPVPHYNWASMEALAYTHEEDKAPPEGNEWANQATFDYQGNALPVLKRIKEVE